jgi:hypothetical protein
MGVHLALIALSIHATRPTMISHVHSVPDISPQFPSSVYYSLSAASTDMDSDTYQRMFTSRSSLGQPSQRPLHKSISEKARSASGSKHVQALIDNAADTDAETERVLNSTRPGVHLSPHKQYLRAKVRNLWDVFYSEVLGKE